MFWVLKRAVSMNAPLKIWPLFPWNPNLWEGLSWEANPETVWNEELTVIYGWNIVESDIKPPIESP